MKSLVLLIGYRGAGKTTVGRLLASRLGWKFIDADVQLEERAAKTIKEIFATQGELAFRDMESAIVRELCQEQSAVIATGGGVVGRDENRGLLRQAGLVVWLKGDATTLAARLDADPSTPERRPNLTVGGLAEIETLLVSREPLYRETAHLEIDTRERSPEAIAETILSAWHSSGSKSSG